MLLVLLCRRYGFACICIMWLYNSLTPLQRCSGRILQPKLTWLICYCKKKKLLKVRLKQTNHVFLLLRILLKLQYLRYTFQKVKVKLATVIEGDPKAPFSIATTLRCRRRALLHSLDCSPLLMIRTLKC